MKKTLLLVTTFLSLTFTTKAQLVEVTPDQNKLVKLVAAAGSKIPFVGPIITPLAAIIFGEPQDPGYKEMKIEWEGYTDQKINEQRKNNVLALLNGKRNKLKTINTNDSLIIADPRLKDTYKKKKIEIWESIISTMDEDIIVVKSQENEPTEPAGPLLAPFSFAANLYIMAYDALIRNLKYTQPDDRDATLKLREVKCKEMNAMIEYEIQKTAVERGNLLVRKQEEVKGNPNNEGWVTIGNSHWVFDIKTNKSTRKIYVPLGLPGPSSHELEPLYQEGLNYVKNEVISNARKLYLIPIKTILKIELLSADVTDDMLWEMFSLNSPYPRLSKSQELAKPFDMWYVKRWGILYQKLDPVKNETVYKMGPIHDSEKADGWISSQAGYVEMETSFAVDELAFWNGPKGSAFALGERSLNLRPADAVRLLAPGINNKNLSVEIDYLFDPWEWKEIWKKATPFN